MFLKENKCNFEWIRLKCGDIRYLTSFVQYDSKDIKL